MTRTQGQPVALAAATLIGLAIGWMDSRPGWDDTGVSAAALFLGAAACASVAPRRPWLTALAVGVWIPLHAIVVSHDPTMLLVLLIPALGAYGGAGMRRLLAPR